MKKLLFSVILSVFASFHVHSQIVNIPDPNFKKALISRKVDKNKDGLIQKSEAEAVTHLNISSSFSISNMAGIEAFKNLVSLNCGGNTISKLNLQKNLLLKELICNKNLLTSLDLSKNRLLCTLNCTKNPLLPYICIVNFNYLSSSNDFNKDKDAEWRICSMEPFVVIPDSNFKKSLINQGIDLNFDKEIQFTEALLPETLTVSNANIVNIKGIEAFKNLYYFDCSYNSISALDSIRGISRLKHLNCSVNNLTNLNLFPNDNLVKVYCHSNQISSFKISRLKNRTLRTLVITNNKLTYLNVRTSTFLTKLWSYNNPNLNTVCVANVAYAETNPEFRKNSFATYTSSCGYVAREGQIFEEEESIISEDQTLYPNPAKEILNVNSNELVQEIIIKNLDGQKLISTSQKKMIDISSLTTGVYLVEIIGENGLVTKKLVVE